MPKKIVFSFRPHIPDIINRFMVVLIDSLHEVLQGCDVCTTARGKQYTEDDVSHKFHLPPPIGSNVIFISPTFVSISSPTVAEVSSERRLYSHSRTSETESVAFVGRLIIVLGARFMAFIIAN